MVNFSYLFKNLVKKKSKDVFLVIRKSLHTTKIFLRTLAVHF